MARDGRPADGQDIGDLLDGPFAGTQQLDDGSPVRVAERVEGVPDGCGAVIASGRPLGASQDCGSRLR